MSILNKIVYNQTLETPSTFHTRTLFLAAGIMNGGAVSWPAPKSLVILILLLYTRILDCKTLAKSAPQALVFGGNGLLGASTVEKLLVGGFHVTTINRGNWYWDSGIKIKPRVHHVTCDRLLSLKSCKEIAALSKSKFDVAVDFSGYHRFQIQEVFDIWQDRIGLYIYISSDSVFEVCNKSHDGYSQETDAVRPNNVLIREEYAKKDSYGHRKLLCEEELQFQNMKWGVPFVSLRLPDVIGPRDNTYRWWIYQLMIRLYPHLNSDIKLPRSFCEKPLSLVHSDDVAEVIFDLCSQNPEKFAHGKAYNLAFKENPSLFELLDLMKSELEMPDVPVTCGEEPGVHLYPSVTLGPVNTSLAERELSWNPTPLTETVKELVTFYESASRNPEFRREQEGMLNSAHIARNQQDMSKAFNKVYLTMSMRDEL